jgi:glyoxylase-like metal-dependent hydrolase (beta-lactamase superfamily II)
MRRLLTFLLFSLSLFGFDYKLKPVTVTTGVHCFFGAAEVPDQSNGGNMVNSCYADMGSGWLVIDSGPTYRYAEQAYAAITNAFGKKPVPYVIDTHLHDDHWLGNGFYKEQGATIIGSSTMKTQIDTAETTRMERSITKDAFEKTAIVLPDIYVDDAYTLKMDHHSIEIKQLTPIAHTNGDLVVTLPLRKTLFVGDICFSESVLSLRDGDIKGWLAALEKIDAMEWSYLVGGHGRKTGKDATHLTRSYLRQLLENVRAAIADGVEIDAVTETVTMDDFAAVPLYDALHKKNVFKAYQLLEWEE